MATDCRVASIDSSSFSAALSMNDIPTLIRKEGSFMARVADVDSATITYVFQPDRTMIVRVKQPGKDLFELIVDVYSEEELAAPKDASSNSEHSK